MYGVLNYSLGQAAQARAADKQAEALQQWNDARAAKRKLRSEKMKVYWAERKAREAKQLPEGQT